MTFVFFWLAFAIIVGVAANSRGRSGFGYFLLAAILSPLIVGLLVIALPRVGAAAAAQFPPVSPIYVTPGLNLKPCGWCGEHIQPTALICRFCDRDPATAPRPEPVVARPVAAEVPPGLRVTPVLVGLGAVVIGALGFAAMRGDFTPPAEIKAQQAQIHAPAEPFYKPPAFIEAVAVPVPMPQRRPPQAPR